ncbi:hypothetical protein [Flavobacterium okayamense]|uniref:Uncharacterized protein n=1 Tax=Flavobacterium okayamense TaxID=2830782 RepID=A0ABN6HU64_9FLAO|nr:hypothetical protein [Flavobacterium okayamense]BCY27966.1 hypothetical protein KK2020170_08340 [Flavobacterium okayamense]
MKFIYSILFVLVLAACNNFSDLDADSEKTKARNEQVFKTISKEWNFVFPKARPEIENTLKNWENWNQFQKELEQKPKTSLLAFQMKIKNVAQRADSLHVTVPEKYNNPQVRSRLITLDTQLNSLNTYMHLQVIPEKKVTSLIKTINEEIKSVYIQIEEIHIKEAIPTEIGEEEMIRALDTTRMASSSFFEENLEKIDSTGQQNNNTERKKTPFKRK